MASPNVSGTNTAILSLTAAVLTARGIAVMGAGVASLTLAAATLTPGKLVAGSGVASLILSASKPSSEANLGKLNLLIRLIGTYGASTIGMTVSDVALDIYGLFRIEVKSPTALELARPRILGAINSVMQQIWSRADKLNYFNQESLEVSIVSGATTVTLPDDVQSVIGPVAVVGGKTLAPLASRESLINYLDYYFGGVSPAIQPPCYFLECAQDLSQGDRTSIKIEVPWAATDDYPLVTQVVKSVPRYTEADLINATPIRLPAKYVELLFLPLVREWASQDYLFKSETARPAIAAAATSAREALGLLEPAAVLVKKTKQEATP